VPTAACHSFFWEDKASTPPAQAGASGGGGYIPFQAVIVGSLVLMLLLQG
jgi:hypothetical protein